MKSIFKLTLMMFAAALIMQSCEEDPASPSVMLDNTELSAKAGEQIVIVATVTAPGGFSKLSIQKFWGDDMQGDPTEVTTLTDGAYTYTYTVTEDDVEPILKFQFVAIDNDGKASSPIETVVDVELTMTQLLLKYDWLLSDEIRGLTGESDISDVYTDDVYRFYEDGTYDKSIGAKVDAFNDIWYNHCYWNLDEVTGQLLMARTGAYLGQVYDTLNITSISSTLIEADVTYYGLDAFNVGGEDVPYEAVEEYVKKLAAQPRSANFDPYLNGPDDDLTGPANACNDVPWN